MRLLLFLFLLVPILHVTARVTLFDRNVRITVPTFDFFEHRQNPYNVTGVACRISLVRDPKTKLCKVAAPPPLGNDSFLRSFDQTVMYIIFDQAYECGMTTISQVFAKAHEMLPLLERAGYPPSRTLIIFTNALYRGVAGCPIGEPYIASSITIPDSPPPRSVNVALVGGAGTAAVVASNITSSFIINAVQDTDLWNKMFLSVGYLFFTWTNATVYFVSIVMALRMVLKAHQQGSMVVDLRNVVFWMAFSVAILYAIALPMRYQTYLRRNLEAIANMLCSTAFHALLYLWSVILISIQPNVGIYVLQFVVLIGVLTTLASCVFNILLANIPGYAAGMETFANVIFNVTIPVQCLMAALFIAFGAKFYARKGLVNASPRLVTALTRLSLVGFLGFGCIAITATTNLPYFRDNACQPHAMLVMIVMREMSILMRVMALLFALGVKTNRAESREASAKVSMQTK